MKKRLNVFLPPEHVNELVRLATVKRVSQSSLVATALSNLLSPEEAERREIAATRRMDKLVRQFEHLERDQTILIETLALFIKHYLTVTPSVPEGQQNGARAQGRARFEHFIEQLGRHLQRGTSALSAIYEKAEATASTTPPSAGSERVS